jgi:hypothetical protein
MKSKNIYKMIPISAKTCSVSLELSGVPLSVYDINTKVDLHPFPKRKYTQQSPLIVRHREDRRLKYQPSKNQSPLFSVAGIAIGYILILLYMEVISIDKFPKLKKLLKPISVLYLKNA